MNNFKLTIAYDGTRYHGWQVQPAVPTIQGELEDTIGRILDHPVSIHGSGRTDRGVHADGQVAHFLTPRHPQTDTLEAGLNALLPPDIRVLAIEAASPRFHARYSARRRTYRYHISRLRTASPFDHRYVYGFRAALDADAVDRATRQLRGVHDFSSFCAGAAEAGDPVREVYEARWERTDAAWMLTISANGFLRSMVRTIVGTLLDVGTGRRPWTDIDRVLEARNRSVAGRAVPPTGLRLVRVDYGEESGNQVENNNLSI